MKAASMGSLQGDQATAPADTSHAGHELELISGPTFLRVDMWLVDLECARPAFLI